MGPSWAKLGPKLGSSCDLGGNLAEHGREDGKLKLSENFGRPEAEKAQKPITF